MKQRPPDLDLLSMSFLGVMRCVLGLMDTIVVLRLQQRRNYGEELRDASQILENGAHVRAGMKVVWLSSDISDERARQAGARTTRIRLSHGPLVSSNWAPVENSDGRS